LHHIPGFFAETRELLVRQQAVFPQGEDAYLGHRPAHVVEGLGHLAVATFHELVYGEISFVIAPARIGADAPDFLEDTPAKSVEGDRVQLPQNLSIRLCFSTRHG
jgi:hypothetical protein